MTDLPSRECQVGHKATTTILHRDANSSCPLRGGGNRHEEVAVSNACGLPYLPMDSCRYVRLTIVGIRPVLARHIKHKVTYLTIKIALVDIPLFLY